ncbi:MAG: heavy-metal-associated domain-containing protein [Thermodesulfobacteriota bacterium]
MVKIVLTVFFILVMLMPSRYGLAKEATAVLHVSGMTCSSCPITIRHRALKMKGVHKAVVKMSTATATVTYEDTEQSPEAIARAITKLGYPANIKVGGK